ncbi:MAG: TetR/AcrR family transcriptional regulator [Anaerovoracaceae bacterium]|jgi:AcrR family transcriptional regulator
MGKRPHITDQTRANLIQSFWDLLEEKPLDKITVKEITNHAGYYRSTFYQYFDDISDLLSRVEHSLIVDIKKQARASLSSRSAEEFIPISELFYSENSRYLKILLGQNAHTSFITDLKSELRLLILSCCGCPEEDPESKYIIEYALSALLGTVSLWFRSGEDIPIDRLTEIVNSITKKLMAQVLKR